MFKTELLWTKYKYTFLFVKKKSMKISGHIIKMLKLSELVKYFCNFPHYFSEISKIYLIKKKIP